MTILEKILYLLCTKNLVPKEALLALAKNRASVEKQIRSLVSEGWIRQINCTFKFNDDFGRRQETFHCFVTTQVGLYMLWRRSGGHWLAQMDVNADSPLNVMGRGFSRSSSNARRFLLEAITSVMADVAGASEHFIFYNNIHVSKAMTIDDGGDDDVNDDDGGDDDVNDDVNDDLDLDDDDDDDDDDDFSLELGLDPDADDSDNPSADDDAEKEINNAKAKSSTLSSYVIGAWPDTNPAADDDIRFLNIRVIKCAVSRADDAAELRDVSYARFTGVVESSVRSAAIYVATSASAVVFRRRLLERELALYTYTKKHLLWLAPDNTNTESLLLVTDPTAFERTFFYKENHLARMESEAAKGKIKNLRQKRQQFKHSTRECGNQFTHMWVIPVSIEGAYELRHIMTTDIDKEYETITERILDENDDMAKSGGVIRKIFPLEDEFECVYAIGIHIDAVQIRALDRVAKTDEATCYYVLCQEWQVPFYKKVLKYAVPYPLRNLIRYQDVYEAGPRIEMACEKYRRPETDL